MSGGSLVQALVRGLDALNVVAEAPSGIGLRELASNLDLKVTTAHNLVRTLVAKGFIEKSAGPVRYRLGGAVSRLCELRRGRMLLRSAAGAVREVFQRHGSATVVFAELHDGRVATSLRACPEQPRIVEYPDGRTLHPYGCASSLAFQAFWSEEERSAYRRRNPFWEFGARLWGTEKNLDEFLVSVRKKGYAAPDLDDLGESRFAAPVFTSAGALCGVLGAAVVRKSSGAAERKAIIKSVVEAARELSSIESPAAHNETGCVDTAGQLPDRR